MKVLFLNGSPRLNGNTRTALKAVSRGIEYHMKDTEIDFYDVVTHNLSACIACDGCKRNGGKCVLPDESAEIIQKIYDADVVIFGSPVYWWGISSQLKMVIDKMYSKDDEFKKQKKSIGVITVGAADLMDAEYDIIKGQFRCIADYLGWDFKFYEPISASEPTDLINEPDVIQSLKNVWRIL